MLRLNVLIKTDLALIHYASVHFKRLIHIKIHMLQSILSYTSVFETFQHHHHTQCICIYILYILYVGFDMFGWSYISTKKSIATQITDVLSLPTLHSIHTILYLIIKLKQKTLSYQKQP